MRERVNEIPYIALTKTAICERSLSHTQITDSFITNCKGGQTNKSRYLSLSLYHPISGYFINSSMHNIWLPNGKKET